MYGGDNDNNNNNNFGEGNVEFIGDDEVAATTVPYTISPSLFALMDDSDDGDKEAGNNNGLLQGSIEGGGGTNNINNNNVDENILQFIPSLSRKISDVGALKGWTENGLNETKGLFNDQQRISTNAKAALSVPKPQFLQ
ncbi:hypothetical protein H4219_005170 [Mycoemilia scoparia]|uniref:Uncharacterized protein n=1 Tax=Mycoemilia scoparia TaxID=417184 RepID=A0A9W7ZQ41_9FUNG|nr:hypothetical protein H4219_005170 [Mycoemilia scoparia]